MLPHPDLGFYFYPFAIGSYCIASDADGNTTTFSRDFGLSIRQVVEKYGHLKPNGHIDWENSLSPYIKSLWDAGKYQDELILSNVILPNKKPKENPLFSMDKRFQSYTYVSGGGSNVPNQERMGFAQQNNPNERGGKNRFLSVRGYDYFPVIAPRWEVQAEEDWGIDGPSEMALGYVNALQEKERYRLEAIAKIVKPPMMGPSQLRRHQASILAGGITYFDEGEQGTFKRVFDLDPKLNDLLVSQSEDERDIDTCYFKDLFLMLAGERPTSHVTAVQIQEMAGERLSAITPILGQLDQDQNGPLTENAHYILHSQGRLPEPPKILKGKPLKVEYTSALAQAAKASQMKTIERTVNFTASLSQVLQDPSILQMLNSEELLREYYSNAGLEPSLYRDKGEFAQIKQAVAQQQAQREAAQAEAQRAETAKTMSQAKLGENSMLDNAVG